MATRRERVPNRVLANLRDSRALTQQEVAEGLRQLPLAKERGIQVDNMTYSRWERGVIERPSPIYRRLLAEFFGVALDELGFQGPVRTDGNPSPGPDLDALMIGGPSSGPEPKVDADRSRWRQERRRLNEQRVALARVASDLYGSNGVHLQSGLVSHPDWLPSTPVPLDAVQLTYTDSAPPPAITGSEAETRDVRPLHDLASRYQRYSHAIRDLAHPGLFENRLSYRLLGASWDGHGGELEFGHTSYFEAVDVGEALAHETAASHLLAQGDEISVRRATWSPLPFRKLIGDPTTFAHRPQLASIDTLTICRHRDGRATFVLHDRSAARVAVAGGMLHIMPAGVFQPSSIEPTALEADFSLWRNIMREYSEEFLGNVEHGGDGRPVDYSAGTFAVFEREYQAGRVRPWWLGVGLDPLTLFGEILTAVVIDAEVYEDLFAEMVDVNDEGRVVVIGDSSTPTTAIPFDELTVPRLLEHSALAPAAAACLSLAWQHREILLKS